MAAGVTQIIVLDGTRTPRHFNVNSSDGTPSGNLGWLQTLTGLDGANPTSSANPVVITSIPYAATPLGFQQLSAVNLASASSLTVPTGTLFALIGCAGGNVSWRDDGVAPTAAIGQQIIDGNPPQTFSGNLSVIKFILINASPVLNISYYK